MFIVAVETKLAVSGAKSIVSWSRDGISEGVRG